jgi:flagellar hook assembly protein FlgD
MPHELELKQNYPNPFNPATTIEFTLPRSGYTRLEIYNITGQRVQTLIDRNLPAGSHRVTWTAVDADGQPLPSGIYYYRLTAEGREYSRQMILVK